MRPLAERAYSTRVRRPGVRSGKRSSDPTQEVLAIIEAELGALLDFLPAPLLVTSEAGEILRANRAAVLFLDCAESIIHKPINAVVGAQSIDVSVTVVRHERTVLRLCALQRHHR